MHGLICKAVEGFVRDQHGPEAWAAVRVRSGLSFDSFEALRMYDRDLAQGVIDATAIVLGRGRDAVLEDVGHWICTHPPLEAVRRLIRFTGKTFVNVLYALDEVHDRACMALPGIDLPRYRLAKDTSGEFEITSRWPVPGGAAVLTGVLRAMADDYGTLALIDAGEAECVDGVWLERIHIRVVEQAFHEPREFTLGGIA